MPEEILGQSAVTPLTVQQSGGWLRSLILGFERRFQKTNKSPKSLFIPSEIPISGADQTCEIKNLYDITAGSLTTNPFELLASKCENDIQKSRKSMLT
jgi:hypothetical protein